MQGMHSLLRYMKYLGNEVHIYLEISTFDPLNYTMDTPILIAFICMWKSIRIHLAQRANVLVRDSNTDTCYIKDVA